MAKLDSDVRSLINFLYFEGSSTWGRIEDFLMCPRDTLRDAELWLEPKPGTNEVQLKEGIIEFVIQTDAQLKEHLPSHDFVFGYPITERPRQPFDPRPCFLAMPTRNWLPEVQRVIESAAKGFNCVLSVDNAAPGNIMNDVWQNIRRSDVILADLTGQNANVFYEMGLAHALGKAIIMIKQKDTYPVPFDVRSHKYNEYERDKLVELETWLDSAFRSVPQRYRFDPNPR